MTHHTAPHAAWFRSSHSAENATACVEVADLGGTTGQIAVRDSKVRCGPQLHLSSSGFATFIFAVRRGALGG